jgi:CheY-like chemotaxis protein
MTYHHRVAAGLLTTIAGVFFLVSAEGARGEQAPPEPGPKDAAVSGLLATNPTTPRERARAARILADLGRPDLARGYLKQVLEAKLDDAQLSALAEEFGPAMFTEMAARATLAPEAKQLADAVLGAVNRKLQDPQHLGGLVKQLSDPSDDRRSEALAGLMAARGAAVNPLLAVLADPARAAEQANVRAALAQLRGDAFGPLTGMLECGDPPLVAQAAQTLGAMNASEAALYLLVHYASEKSDRKVREAAGAALVRLLGKLPAPHEAADLLAQYARRQFDRLQPLKTDLAGRVQVWTWDAAKKQVVGRELPADDVSRILAARLAREAYALAPDSPPIRLLYLATMLEQAVYGNGLDNPLPTGEGTPAAKAAAFGANEVDALLKFAMNTGHPAAAMAAAEILGHTGQAEALLRQGNGPAPLVLATRYPNRRLRMAAIGAIVRLQPAGPFPGSSYVPEALRFFAATSGARKALVAGPSSEVSMSLTGYLVPLGYEADVAIAGREVIQKAIGSPDYELILVDAALTEPAPDLLLQQLRRDGRTAHLPVGIIARAEQFERATRMARNDPLARAFHRPHTAEAAKWQIEQLTKLVAGEMVPFAQRQRQAAQAIAWLAELSVRSQGVYDLKRAEDTAMGALYVPPLAPKAAAMLANLGTAESQVALVEIASRLTQPLEVRKAAVVAFGESTRRYGILLTTDQIQRQYDRYNASANQDVATQKTLGLILDDIEAPTKATAQKKQKASSSGQ